MTKRLSMSLSFNLALNFLLFASFPLHVDVFQQWIYQYLTLLPTYRAINTNLLRVMLAILHLQIFSVHLRVLVTHVKITTVESPKSFFTTSFRWSMLTVNIYEQTMRFTCAALFFKIKYNGVKLPANVAFLE